jgi:hypothetical protein
MTKKTKLFTGACGAALPKTADGVTPGKNRTLSPINDLTPCLFCPLPVTGIEFFQEMKDI